MTAFERQSLLDQPTTLTPETTASVRNRILNHPNGGNDILHMLGLQENA